METCLWLSRDRETPQKALSDLPVQCASLDIETYDVYGDFDSTVDKSWLRKFEAGVAENFGMSDAVFMPSGVMAQQIALCIHNKKDLEKRKSSFLCHYSSHLLIHEQNSYTHLLDMDCIVVPPNESSCIQKPMTYEGMLKALESTGTCNNNNNNNSSGGGSTSSCIDKNVKGDTTGTDNVNVTVVIECPHREIGGKMTSMEDLIAISKYCHSHNIPLHMDGARLWEAQVAYSECNNNNNNNNISNINNNNASTTDVKSDSIKALCGLFDTVYVSFYKGIGALSGGAMLLSHDKKFCADARVWLRRFGGNIYSLLPTVVSCWYNYRLSSPYDVFYNRTMRMKEVIKMLSNELNHFMMKCSTETNTTDISCTPDADSNNSNKLTMINQECQGLLRFDPPSPIVCMIHVYFNASVDICKQAQENSIQILKLSSCNNNNNNNCATDSGGAGSGAGSGACNNKNAIRVFSRIRQGQYGASNQSYFEFNMVSYNSY